jgi:hypothetical protein
MKMNKRKEKIDGNVHIIAYTQVFKETMVKIQFKEIQETQDTLSKILQDFRNVDKIHSAIFTTNCCK